MNQFFVVKKSLRFSEKQVKLAQTALFLIRTSYWNSNSVIRVRADKFMCVQISSSSISLADTLDLIGLILN